MSERTFQVLAGCQNGNCATETSYHLDMLRWWNDEPICEVCFDDLLWEDKLKPGVEEDEDDVIEWSDLPGLQISEARA